MTENVVKQNAFVQEAIALGVEQWTRPNLRLKSFFANNIKQLRQRDTRQSFLSTSVGRSLIDDDEVDDVEAERTRVRMMIKVLRL